MEQKDAMTHSIKHSENSVPSTTTSIIPRAPENQPDLGPALTGSQSWSEQVPEEPCSNPTGHWSIMAEHHLS